MEQRSNEWHTERAGKITASAFRKAFMGKQTKGRRQYIEELAFQLDGGPVFTPDLPWFRHGVNDEPEAKALYQLQTGNDVDEVGFIVHPELPHVGASPDGLIGKDGGIEIKSNRSYAQFLKVKYGGVPSIYVPQVQGNMWVTGRSWWDFVSYHKFTRQLAIVRVIRDNEYIARLSLALQELWQEVQSERSRSQSST